MNPVEHDAVCETALNWLETEQVALATVTETWGSAPRPVGSMLAISASGRITGSVSGGCVEGAVIAKAQEALADGQPRILEFGVADEDAFAVGLACGGRISIIVDPIDGEAGVPRAMLHQLVEARSERRPAALLVDFDCWEHRFWQGGTDKLETAIRNRLAAEQSGFEASCFVNVFAPPLRLIVVGAVHIAQPLLTMAKIIGYDCILVDPRTAFGSEERFPGQQILDDWPDEAVKFCRPDSRTAIVTLTHDPKLDDPAIMSAIDSEAFYIGCLGSRRTHAGRLARLRMQGVPEDSLARLRGPVGVDIGACSPSEIALSILAEITMHQRKPV